MAKVVVPEVVAGAGWAEPLQGREGNASARSVDCESHTGVAFPAPAWFALTAARRSFEPADHEPKGG